MKNIKLLLPLLAIFSLSISACHKDKAYMNDAVITGTDGRMCACCGGLMLNLGDNTEQYIAGHYIVDKLPEGFILDSNTRFPAYVRIDWEQAQNAPCSATNHMIVTRIEGR